MCIIHRWKEFGHVFRYCQKCEKTQIFCGGEGWSGWTNPRIGELENRIRDSLAKWEKWVEDLKAEREKATYESQKEWLSHEINSIEADITETATTLIHLQIDVYQKVST